MINKENFLYSLIQTMGKNEKRFFKLQTQLYSKNKKPNYLILFEELDETLKCEVELLESETKDINLSKDIYYLRKQLLNSIRLYQNKNIQLMKELEHIGSAFVLIDRNFIKEAEKILQTHKKKAIKNERNILAAVNNS